MNDCYHNTLVRFLFCLISFGLVLPPLRGADAGAAVATVFLNRKIKTVGNFRIQFCNDILELTVV